MAVTQDDTTQGAVAPTPKVISPGGQSPPSTQQLQNQGSVPKPPPQAAPGVMRFEEQPTPHIPQPIPPQIMRSEAANATEILWSSRAMSIRAGKLPVQVVQQVPWTALAIAQSSLSNDQIEQVGQTIEATWAYIRAQVGTDEWMTAKARAMFIANPVARAEALDYMDRQSHGTGGMGSPFGRQTMAEAVELLSRDFEFQLPNGQTVTGPIAAYTNGHPFNSSWLSPPMNVVDAVLSTIFSPIDTASRGIAAGAGYVLSLLPHGVSAGLGAIGVNEDVSDRIAESLQDLPTEVYEGVNTAFARASDLASAIPLAMSQYIGRAPLPFGLDEKLEPVPFSDWKKYLWPEEQGTGFGRAMAAAGGLKPGDPGYGEIVSTVNFLGQLILGAKVAKVTGAMKSALREGLPEGYGAAIEGGPIPGSRSPLTGALAEQPFTLASEFRLSLTQRYGSMGRMVFEMLAKEPSEWVKTGMGRRRFEELNDLVHQTNGVAKVVEVYRPGSYTIDMLESMRATTTIEQARQVYVRTTRGLPDPMFRGQQLARLTEIDKRIALIDELNQTNISEFGAEVSLRVRRDLESQRVVIANRMDRPFSAPPIRYPSKPIIMEMLGVAGDGPYSRFMSTTVGKARSWFQEGTNDPLTRPGTAPWAKERNAAVLRKRANVAGIPRDLVRSLLDDLGKLPEGDLTGWERWVQKYHEAFIEAKHIDRALLDRFTRWGTKDPLEHAGSWISQRLPDPDRPGGYRTIRRPVLEVKRFNPITGEDISVPLRNMTAMGLGDEVHVAPYDVLVDASSLYRKLIRKGKAAHPLNPGHWAATIWDGGAFMMDSATAVFKSMALTGYGLRTIPLTTRILGEEILARTPGYMYQWFDSRDLSMFDVAAQNGRIITPLSSKIQRTLKGGPFRSPLASNDTIRAGDLGSVVMDDHIRGMSSGYHWVSSMPDGRTLSPVAAEGLAADLAMALKSPEQRSLLRIGPSKWVDKVLADKDAGYEFLRPKVEQVWAQRIGKDVAEFGVEDVHAAWMDYATTERTFLEQLAGGNKNLIDAIRTGQDWKWLAKRDSRTLAATVPDAAVRERYGDLLTDEARYRTNLKGAIQDGRPAAELAAARTVWMKSLDDLRSIEREHGIPVNWGEVSLDKPRSLAQALQNATANGEYMPPQQVRVIYHDRKVGPAGQKHYIDKFGDDLGTLRGVLGSMADAASTFGYWPMAKVTSKLDIRWARGPLYKKAARDAYDRMRASGWSHDRAVALAKYQGAETARRIMYDLGATSRFDKAVRNIFWFLPAYRELMATWMVKIPSQYYWPVGAAYLANRAHLVVDWLSGTGLIDKNADGEWQTSLPFMGNLLNHLTGTDTVKHIVTLDPGSLNFVASGPTFHGVPLPGFSKPYNVLLTQLALRNPEAWKGLADVMLPYGPDITAGTPALNNFYYWLRAQTGDTLPVTPPWDHFWPQHSKAQWDLAADDALRIARTTVGPPPNLQDDRYAKDESGHMTLPAQRLYERDWDEWKDDMAEAKQRILQSTFLVRMIGSTVFPASLQVSNNYKNDANALLDELYGHRPADYFENPGSAEAIAWRERRDKANDAFLKDHPDGFFFLISKTAAGEQAPFDPYRTAAGEDDFWMRLFKDYRITLDEETYLERASGMESYRWMTANVNADLEQMGGDAPAILRNWYERSSSLETRSESWQDYLTLHEDFAAFLKDQSNIWASDPKNKLPDLSLQAERLLQAHSALKSIDELFSVDGIRNKDVRTVERLIADILFGTGPGQEGVNFGPPRTQVEKDVAWWWESVGRPYLDKVNTLVDSAFAAQGLGDMELAGTYWSKIRDMANASPGVSHNGMAFPSAQEVFWGSKTLQEQHRSVLAWQTKPIAWLTNFQRTKAGWGNIPGANDFFDKADEKWDAFYDFVQDPNRPGHYREGYSPNSNAYDQLYNQTKAAVDSLARQSGPAIYDLYRLNIAAPALRLAQVGNSPAIFDALAAQASDVSEAIEAEGFSPKGWGETATELKISFFKSVESAWRSNAGLKSYLKNVMHVMTLPGGDIERDGALLYDALFFGNFKPPGQIGSIPQGFTSSFSSLIGFQPPTPTSAPTGGAPSGGYGGGSSGGVISPAGTGG